MTRATEGLARSVQTRLVSHAKAIVQVAGDTPCPDLPFGRKYTVIGMLTSPVGVVQVVTVWLEEPGRAGVRLVTVQPR